MPFELELTRTVSAITLIAPVPVCTDIQSGRTQFFRVLETVR